MSIKRAIYMPAIAKLDYFYTLNLSAKTTELLHDAYKNIRLLLDVINTSPMGLSREELDLWSSVCDNICKIEHALNYTKQL